MFLRLWNWILFKVPSCAWKITRSHKRPCLDAVLGHESWCKHEEFTGGPTYSTFQLCNFYSFHLLFKPRYKISWEPLDTMYSQSSSLDLMGGSLFESTEPWFLGHTQDSSPVITAFMKSLLLNTCPNYPLRTKSLSQAMSPAINSLPWTIFVFCEVFLTFYLLSRVLPLTEVQPPSSQLYSPLTCVTPLWQFDEHILYIATWLLPLIFCSKRKTSHRVRFYK